VIWHTITEHWLVVIGGALNFAAGVFGLLFAAQVPDSVLAGVALFVAGTGTALIGWSLATVVSLARVVSRLEATVDDHDRRLTKLAP
jgi:hypothetical protein